MGTEALTPPKKPKLVFSSRLPRPASLGRETLLAYDRVLEAQVPGFAEWAAKFPARYAVEAGEKLKSLDAFPVHMRSLLELAQDFSPRTLRIVAVGGGSVGDFAGFVASILKRGVDLVHIPSTWLSAIDSAHGGKTALNVGGIKNQIGTFHPASEIHIVRSLLQAQGEARVVDAWGELLKIALLQGGAFWSELSRARRADPRLLWKFLPRAIAAKYRIVARDPFERKGPRQLLNFGHSLGHVLEAYHGLSHGAAVAQGLLFALDWSATRGRLPSAQRDRLRATLIDRFGVRSLAGHAAYPPIPKNEFVNLLRGDKKRASASRLRFIFLAAPGKPRIEEVSIEELTREAIAQGWAQGEARA